MKGLWHGIKCPDGNKAYSSSIFLVLLSGYLRGVEVGLLWPILNTCATSHGKETRQYHLLQIWMSLNFFVGESISGEGVYVRDESHTYIAWPLPTQMVGGQKCTPFKCAMGQLLYELWNFDMWYLLTDGMIWNHKVIIWLLFFMRGMSFIIQIWYGCKEVFNLDSCYHEL